MNSCTIRISLPVNASTSDIVKRMNEARKEYPTSKVVVYDKIEHKIVVYEAEIHDALKATEIYA